MIWHTVLNRLPGFYDAQFELFWSYNKWLEGNWELGKQILANIAMFVPLGFLLSAVISSHKKSFLFVLSSGFLFSGIIEIFQFEFMRGLFEYDDIFNNTLGALLGYLLYKLVEKLVKKDYTTKITLFLGVMFVVAAMFVCLNVRDLTGESKPNIPYDICFQADSVSLDGNKFIPVLFFV